LPYTVFSIFYQWKIAQQWCVLCVMVQAILVLEAVTMFTAGMHGTSSLLVFTPYNIIWHTIFFLSTAIAWLLIKPLLLHAKEGQRNRLELMRLKRNPQIFESLLLRQKAVEYDTTGLGIIIGNPNARNKIIKVCDPYCSPCSMAHSVIEELLHDNIDVKVQIIFTTNDGMDVKALTAKHLMAIADKGDPALLHNALDDWYNAPKKDYDIFSAKYKLNGELQQQGNKLQAMREWCEKTEIPGTPTFFINGFQLPELFTMKDLKLFLTN